VLSINDKSNILSIITPQLLTKELESIGNTVELAKLALPFVVSAENLPLYYEIAEIESTLVKNQIIICFSIPIIKPIIFNLYKINSVPIRQNNGSMFTFAS